MHPDVLDVDQDPDGADRDVLRVSIGESLAFDLVGPGRAPGHLAPATIDLSKESPGLAAGADESVPGAGIEAVRCQRAGGEAASPSS